MTGEPYAGIPAEFLTGAFAPVSEEVSAFGLSVSGEIPHDLNGLYVRNGGNPPPVPYDGHYHWFLGDGMLFGVDFADGNANWYRNRWVRTDALAEKLPITSSGGPEDVALFNPSNTSIIEHAGRLLSLNEFGFPYEVDRELNTLGRHDFGGSLKKPMLAHPKIDPATGDMFFLSGEGEPPHAWVHRVDAAGVYQGAREAPTKGPTLIHDMGMTENYVVVFDFPIIFDLEYMAEEGFPFRWDDNYGTRFGVMPKSDPSAPIRWFEVPPVYFIHLINAFEQGDEIVLDAPAVDRYMERGNADVLRQPEVQSLRRWHLDLKTGESRVTQTGDKVFELPRINDQLCGRANRFGYGVTASQAEGRTVFENIAKYDTGTGDMDVFDVGRGNAAAEAVFVPRPGGSAEDNGWLLAYVYQADRDATDLYILNADDFTGEPAAIVHLPARVPLGFHGTFVPHT